MDLDDKKNLFKKIIAHLPLLDKDRESFKKNRGFTDDVIDKMGFRSCGAFLRDDPFINALPPKIKNSLFVDNVLIPYYGPDSEIIHLRPHKFGFKDEGIQVYVPFQLLGDDVSTIVIAESEFKAVASCMLGVPAIGIPGIASMSRSKFNILRDVLQTLAPDNVIICFDNEIKDDPKFDNFKPDYTKRYDTQFYSFVTATLLSKAFPKVKIATLRPEWMVNGKADIDGILAAGIDAESYLSCLEEAKYPKDYKDSWDFHKAHTSFLERRIDRFFYNGRIEERHGCYFVKNLNDGSDAKVSNFVIRVLHTMTGEDKTERYCKFVSKYGDSEPMILTPEAMASKQTFLKMCYENGDYEFNGSDEHLKQIWSYIFMNQDGRIVNKLNYFGYNEDANTWFFDNGAYRDDVYYPKDENGMVWIDDFGYRILDSWSKNSEGMAPTLISDTPESVGINIKQIFEHIAIVYGVNRARIILGWTLGTFFMPEILESLKVFPFLFVYGKVGMGKSTISNFISSFFGFTQKGFPLAGSSIAGIRNLTSQMSMVPVWLEEYRNKESDIASKNNMLRNIYDRNTTVKASLQKNEIVTYKSRATLIISGQETSSDSALNSRCIMFPMTNNYKTTSESFMWLETNKGLFPTIGHQILTNKKKMWLEVKEHIDGYVEGLKENLSEASIRTIKHNAIVAGIVDAFLGETSDFTDYVKGQVVLEDEKLVREAALTVFLEDVSSMLLSGAIPSTFFETKEGPEDMTKHRLRMDFNSSYKVWEQKFKNLRSEIPASKEALIDHMENEQWVIYCNKSMRISTLSVRGFEFNAGHPRCPEPIKQIYDNLSRLTKFNSSMFENNKERTMPDETDEYFGS